MTTNQEKIDPDKIFDNLQSKISIEDLKKKHSEAFLSIKQKSWSSSWYFRVIQEFNPADNNIATDPGVIAPIPKQQADQPSGLTTSNSTVTINSPILFEKDKLYLINLLFDGFIWNAKSILDCFANEIRFIYSLGGYSKKRKLHFDDLPKLLNKNHTARKLTELLKSIKQDDWYKQLNKYRDTTTHKNVIPKEIEYTTKERVGISLDTPKIKTKEGKIFLKKDPEDENSEEVDLKIFTANLNKSIRQLIKNAYSAIHVDIEKKQDLPLVD